MRESKIELMILTFLLKGEDVPIYEEDVEALNMAINSLEQEPTTKNDLGVDAVSRQAINIYIDYILNHGMGKKKSFDFIKKFVTNLSSVTPQEQFKPMVEIDLYSVIKQKYIEREVLDKLRAEIETLEEGITSYHNDRPWVYKDEVLKIIDKYMGENKEKKMNNWVKVKIENNIDNYKNYDIIYLNINQVVSINIDTNEVTLSNGTVKLASTNDLIKITKEISKNS